MRLRGHHLLCVLGFRGLGYSEGHAESMARIVNQLWSCQGLVEVCCRADDICSSCPFLSKRGCRQKGLEAERRMRRKDSHVIKRLGLKEGERIGWPEILDRIRSSLSSSDLDRICQDCEWLPSGYCKEGLEKLRVLNRQRCGQSSKDHLREG